jgi:hypothetical protein
LRLLGLVVGAVVLLFVAGCGGGSEESASTEVKTETVTGATPTAATTTGITDSQAKAAAESMLLRLKDFPTGWRADAPGDEEGCAGIEKLRDRYIVLAKAESDDFARGDSTEAASSAGIFGDEAQARDALNYLEGSVQSERFRDCLNDSLRKDARLGVTFGDVRVGQASFPALGDRSSAWEIVVPFETQGISESAYIDAVFIRRGTALGIVFFSDVFSPFDEQMREHLVRLVDERMKDAVSEIE